MYMKERLNRGITISDDRNNHGALIRIEWQQYAIGLLIYLSDSYSHKIFLLNSLTFICKFLNLTDPGDSNRDLSDLY